MSERQQTGTLVYKVMARSPLQRGKATCRGEYGTLAAAKILVAELRAGASPTSFVYVDQVLRLYDSRDEARP